MNRESIYNNDDEAWTVATLRSATTPKLIARPLKSPDNEAAANKTRSLIEE
jgi:hypothetical protein